MKPKFINITGNIGAGKTTLMGLLAKTYNWHPVYENYVDEPYFDDFYANMSQWAFHHQVSFLVRSIHLQQDQILALQSSLSASSVIMHDNIFNAHNEVFARTMYEEGLMSLRDYTVYKDLTQRILRYFCQPDLVIYLKVDPKVLLPRIIRRSRQAETDISITYLEKLGVCYDECVRNLKCPMLSINGNDIDFVTNEIDKEAIIDKIKQFVDMS